MVARPPRRDLQGRLRALSGPRVAGSGRRNQLEAAFAARGAFDELHERRARHRAVPIETLRLVGAEFLDQQRLAARLDALDDDRAAAGVRELDDRLHDAAAARIGFDVDDERAVELE